MYDLCFALFVESYFPYASLIKDAMGSASLIILIIKMNLYEKNVPFSRNFAKALCDDEVFAISLCKLLQ